MRTWQDGRSLTTSDPLIDFVPVVCATLIGLFIGVGLMIVLAPSPEPVRLDFRYGTVPLERSYAESDVMCTYHTMWLDEGDVC